MTDYDAMLARLDVAIGGERDPIANAANVAAFLFRAVPELNWAGFYFMRDEELVLGPFCGEPAVTRIAVGRGVCGTAIAEVRTIAVDDVHAFADHIACDTRSNAELVIPLAATDRLVGVLDLDSPTLRRFADPADVAGIEALAKRYVEASDFALFPRGVVRAGAPATSHP